MNKLSLANVFMAILLLGISSTAWSQDVSIGVVNANKVLENSPQAEAAREKIQREFAPRDRQLVEEQKKLKRLEDKLSKDGAIMSEEERAQLEREIVQLKRDIKRTQDEFREDLNFRRNEEFGEIQKSILEAVQQVAQQKGYDIVLGQGVIYASNKVDISDQVIEYLKQKHNAGGG